MLGQCDGVEHCTLAFLHRKGPIGGHIRSRKEEVRQVRLEPCVVPEGPAEHVEK